MQNYLLQGGISVKVNGVRIRMLLAERCMSAQDLQSDSGVAIASIYRIFSNPDYTPNTKTVGRIARALDVSVKEIVLKEDIV